ncbi:hypothetical protein BH11MYX1_BH11MYX1_04970 [soil metagenome]
MKRLLVLAVLAVVVATMRSAHAYPQFQLVKDQTCSSCHLSPAGGGLLSENGMATAESSSQWGTAPEFFYNKVPLPTWLALGGDVRSAGGYDRKSSQHPGKLVLFPMQAEVYAAATYEHFSLHVTAGARDPQYDASSSSGYDSSTLFASREHWLQWQAKPGESEGLFVRMGRFMPVFGLRFAEHPYYDRRYGGTPLYGETYATAVEYVTPKWEAHLTGFVHDPILPDSIEQGNGGAFYAETRVTERTAVGIEGKLDDTPDDLTYYGGLTAKQQLGASVLVQAEVELIHQKIDEGGKVNKLVATIVGSYFIGPLMIDVGLNTYQSNLSYAILAQEAIDVNLHWFMTSHVEMLLTSRFQAQAWGSDGPDSGYSLVQVHYRL